MDGNIYLQTEKIAGNINACMGFINNGKFDNVYVPNTALKEDIRNIAENRAKIVAILKKEMKENLYTNITYLKQNYQLEDILKNSYICKNIDIDNIHSEDNSIGKKIFDYKKD